MSKYSELSEKIKGIFQGKFEEAASKAAEAVEAAADEAADLVEEAEAEEAESEGIEEEGDPSDEPAIVQVTVRGDSTLHFQAGEKNNYRKGDTSSFELANKVTKLIYKGEAVGKSLAGTSTRYLRVLPLTKSTGALPDGTKVFLPAGLLI